MPNLLLDKTVAKHKRPEAPEFRPGDTIRVHVKIREGEKERLQVFEGTVLARKNTGLGETITVRKVSFGHGVERIFRFTRPLWITSTWFVPAAYDALSFITCAI